MSRVPPVVVIGDAGLPAWVAMAIEAERAALDDRGPILVAASGGGGRELVRARGGAFGAEVIDLPPMPGDDLSAQLASAITLVRAAGVAAELGCSRVVWAEVVGGDPADLSAVEAMAREGDRALLASRLVSLDHDGAGVEIETPFIDMSDAHLAELALDMGLDLEGAAVLESERWGAALRALGWAGTMHEPRGVGVVA